LPVDVAVLVAAVADWTPETPSGRKLKKKAGEPFGLALKPTQDILAVLSKPGPLRPALVVGFAAETHDLESHAAAKLASKGCDWIVANDVSQEGVMGGSHNTVSLIQPAGTARWERASKSEIGARLAAKIAETLASRSL
jgi:phosphopantothenoylcysteine decarboxylase/phosphopantothenate--cysteine ligase